MRVWYLSHRQLKATQIFKVLLHSLCLARANIDVTIIFQLTYKQEGDDEKVTLAVKIHSMTKEEVEEALTFVSTMYCQK